MSNKHRPMIFALIMLGVGIIAIAIFIAMVYVFSPSTFSPAPTAQFDQYDPWGNHQYYIDHLPEIKDEFNKSCADAYLGYTKLPKKDLWESIDPNSKISEVTLISIPVYEYNGYLVSFDIPSTRIWENGSNFLLPRTDTRWQGIINHALADNAYIRQFRADFLIKYDEKTGHSYTTINCRPIQDDANGIEE